MKPRCNLEEQNEQAHYRKLFRVNLNEPEGNASTSQHLHSQDTQWRCYKDNQRHNNSSSTVRCYLRAVGGLSGITTCLVLAWVKYYYSPSMLITSWGVCKIAYFPGCEVINYGLYFCIIFWSIFYLVLLHIWLASKCYKFLPDSAEYETQEILRSPSKSDRFLDMICTRYNMDRLESPNNKICKTRRKVEPNAKIILPIEEPVFSSKSSTEFYLGSRNDSNETNKHPSYNPYISENCTKPSAFNIMDSIHTFLPSCAPPNTPRPGSNSRRRLSKVYEMHNNLTGTAKNMLAREYVRDNCTSPKESISNNSIVTGRDKQKVSSRHLTNLMDESEVALLPGIIKLQIPVDKKRRRQSIKNQSCHRYVVKVDDIETHPDGTSSSDTSEEQAFSIPETSKYRKAEEKNTTLAESNSKNTELESAGSSGIDQRNDSTVQFDQAQTHYTDSVSPVELPQSSRQNVTALKISQEPSTTNIEKTSNSNNNSKSDNADNEGSKLVPGGTCPGSHFKKRTSKIPRPRQSVKFSISAEKFGKP